MREFNEDDRWTEDLTDKYKRVFNVFSAIMEFGVLVCYLTIIIPFMVIGVLFLLALPAIYLVTAFKMPVAASIYMFLIYGGGAAYCVHRFLRDNNRYDDDVDGRNVFEDDRHVPTRSSIRDHF